MSTETEEKPVEEKPGTTDLQHIFCRRCLGGYPWAGRKPAICGTEAHCKGKGVGNIDLEDPNLCVVCADLQDSHFIRGKCVLQ